MAVNQPGGLSNSALTQSIIIALVAGAILTAGMMSIVYRRRRRRRFLLELPGYRLGPGGRLIRIVDMDSSREREGDGGGGGGGGKKKSGRKPKFWDVLVGEEEEGDDLKVIERDKSVDVEGKFKGGWNVSYITLVDLGFRC